MKRYLAVLTFAICVIFLWFVRSRVHPAPDALTLNTTKPDSTKGSLSESVANANNVPSIPGVENSDRQRAVQFVQSIYAAPVGLYGRVQDQFGAPVSGANIEFSVLDRFWESGTKYTRLSEGDGSFSLTGVKGAAVSVAVWKDGYGGIAEKSTGSFSFGVPFDAHRDRPSPTKDNPAIFVLRKKAEADALFVANRDVRISKDGTPVDVSLRTGKSVGHDKGDIRIECWTSDLMKDNKGHYKWHSRVSVPGGGLMVRTDTELDFVAPESGYQPSVEIDMPQDASNWRRDSDAQYWVKLSSGTFARMRFRITTAGGHFATISSYLNPSGSRNLEYDENKVLR